MTWLEPLRRSAGEFMETLGEGWDRLRQRSTGALTRFRRHEKNTGSATALPAIEETWGLLSAELAETNSGLVVRIEAPGMNQDDFEVSVEGRELIVRGEKRFEHEEKDASYYLFESAYGSFERRLPLPCDVRGDETTARYRRGVLTIELPRAADGSRARQITVQS